jgi:hypothetical protein
MSNLVFIWILIKKKIKNLFVLLKIFYKKIFFKFLCVCFQKTILQSTIKLNLFIKK